MLWLFAALVSISLADIIFVFVSCIYDGNAWLFLAFSAVHFLIFKPGVIVILFYTWKFKNQYLFKRKSLKAVFSQNKTYLIASVIHIFVIFLRFMFALLNQSTTINIKISTTCLRAFVTIDLLLTIIMNLYSVIAYWSVAMHIEIHRFNCEVHQKRK